MRLQPGTLVGGYEVVSALGAGGMGEVYRARDTKLKRDVALKVLSADVAESRERILRFQREAEVLASLNHPNIAHLHGLVESEGVTALVMELVEGEDLAQRLKRGPIPIDEALAIARQIAEALETAHEQGIIHRDLKPANIKVRSDGVVKVLDFGLAKALDPTLSAASNHSLANSPTFTSPAATMHGVVLGTTAYMSPEQARGKPVDKRTDVWAFGVVLFEMLTARRPFDGETVSDSVAAILKTDPEWSALPADTPFLIKRLLRHCLNRDPRERLGDMRDARIEIAEAHTTAQPGEISATRHSSRAAWLVSAVSLLGIAAVGVAFALGFIQLTPTPTAPVEARFTVEPPKDVRASFRPVVSPDGAHIAYVGFDKGGFPAAWIHTLADGTSRRLAGSERLFSGASMFWSPDSKSIGFFADGKLKRVDLESGSAIVVCDVAESRGGSWNRRGDIILAIGGNAPISRVPASGGTPEPVTVVDQDGTESHRQPHFLPDDDHFVFLEFRDGIARLMLSSLSRRVSTELRLADGLTGFIEPDVVLLAIGGQLLAQRLDVTGATLVGEAVPVVALQPSGAGIWASVSNTGTIAYRPPRAAGNSVLAWVDRKGNATRLPLPPRAYFDPSLSPDGRHIAMSVRDETGMHIWVYDVQRGSLGKRTFESINAFPIWSRDGRSLTFSTGQTQVGPVLQITADGSGKATAVITSDQVPGQKIPGSWSADGTLLTFQRSQDVFIRSADGSVTPLLTAPVFEREARFAPRGGWIAYRSNESGRDEVYVQSYPLGTGKWQISTDGGAQPMWNPKGTELFYKNGNQLMAVPIELSPTFKPGKPELLFQMPLPESTPGDPSRYAVTPDGQRFLVITTETTQDDSPVHVILNWRGLTARR
jgi:Tol biopolymer transport system component